MKRADVTVHIDEALTPERTGELCQELSHMSGIFKVRCAEHKEHLLLVEYDPDQLHIDQIVAGVQRQGVHAQVFGL